MLDFIKQILHIHTPASKCWMGGRDAKEMESIFQKLQQEKIELVAITDHNTVENIDEAKQLGKKYKIHVFPGVEISTKEGHVLAFFDKEKPTKEIEDWLAKIGFITGKRGDLNALAEDQDGSHLSIRQSILFD